MDRDAMRVCVDRVVPPPSDRAAAALHEALTGRHEHAGRKGLLGPVYKMSLPHLKMWPLGKTLRCRFLEGTPFQRGRAEEIAHQWEDYANLELRFVEEDPAEIRIAFRKGEGSWSGVGSDALVETYFPLHGPTINFGWLEESTNPAEFKRVVLHEFGHALGCIHEHQQPNFAPAWNKETVYAYFCGAPNYWTHDQVDLFILGRYSKEETNSSAFDPKSIMLYHFGPEFFTDGSSTPMNWELSENDKAFIAGIYPKA